LLLSIFEKAPQFCCASGDKHSLPLKMSSSAFRLLQWRRLAAPLAAAAAVSPFFTPAAAVVCEKEKEEEPRRIRKRRTAVQKASTTLEKKDTRAELGKIRRLKSSIFRQWERDEDGWRELPARAWPAYQPNEEELEHIRAHLAQLPSCTPDNSDVDDECRKLLFDVATSLVFYTIDPQAGYEQYKKLAENGHVDAMVACGVILVEGLGVSPREEEGVAWLETAASLGSAQACYELGTVYYTGIDGVIDEDPER